MDRFSSSPFFLGNVHIHISRFEVYRRRARKKFMKFLICVFIHSHFFQTPPETYGGIFCRESSTQAMVLPYDTLVYGNSMHFFIVLGKLRILHEIWGPHVFKAGTIRSWGSDSEWRLQGRGANNKPDQHLGPSRWGMVVESWLCVADVCNLARTL